MSPFAQIPWSAFRQIALLLSRRDLNSLRIACQELKNLCDSVNHPAVGHLGVFSTDVMVAIMDRLPKDVRRNLGATCRLLNALNAEYQDKKVIDIVIRCGIVDHAQRLLEEGVDLCKYRFDGLDALTYSLKTCGISMFRLLLQVPDLVKLADVNRLISRCIQCILLIKDNVYAQFLSELVVLPGATITSLVLVAACAIRSSPLVNYLLANHTHLDPSFDNQRCVKEAATEGALDVVVRLVQDPRVDVNDALTPAGWKNLLPYQQGNHRPINMAMSMCHLEVVAFLLEATTSHRPVFVACALGLGRALPQEKVGVYRFLFDVVNYPEESQEYKQLCRSLYESSMYWSDVYAYYKSIKERVYKHCIAKPKK